MIPRITLMATFTALAACSNQPDNTIQPSDIAKLERLSPVSSRNFDVSFTLKDTEKTLISETKSGRLGSRIKFLQQRKFIYPSSYDLPQIDKEGKFPVTPSTPRKFKSLNAGWTCEFIARQSGGLIILEGDITHISTEFNRGVHGEASDRIVASVASGFVTISENKGYMPTISRITYPLNIRMIPNKRYPISLPNGTKILVEIKTKK